MKKYVAIAGVLVLITAVILINVWARKPSNSTIIVPSTTTPLQKAKQPVVIETAYFTVTLPSGFEIKSQVENATSQDLMQIVATEPRSNGKQIAISVGQLPKEGIAGVASYNLRVKNTDMYTQTEFGGMQSAVPTFYSATPSVYEITGFWPHASLYAAISASGSPSEKTDINNDYIATLDTWKWR
jgi:hypothetical protein